MNWLALALTTLYCFGLSWSGPAFRRSYPDDSDAWILVGALFWPLTLLLYGATIARDWLVGGVDRELAAKIAARAELNQVRALRQNDEAEELHRQIALLREAINDERHAKFWAMQGRDTAIQLAQFLQQQLKEENRNVE